MCMISQNYRKKFAQIDTHFIQMNFGKLQEFRF